MSHTPILSVVMVTPICNTLVHMLRGERRYVGQGKEREEREEEYERREKKYFLHCYKVTLSLTSWSLARYSLN